MYVYVIHTIHNMDIYDYDKIVHSVCAYYAHKLCIILSKCYLFVLSFELLSVLTIAFLIPIGILHGSFRKK